MLARIPGRDIAAPRLPSAIADIPPAGRVPMTGSLGSGDEARIWRQRTPRHTEKRRTRIRKPGIAALKRCAGSVGGLRRHPPPLPWMALSQPIPSCQGRLAGVALRAKPGQEQGRRRSIGPDLELVSVAQADREWGSRVSSATGHHRPGGQAGPASLGQILPELEILAGRAQDDRRHDEAEDRPRPPPEDSRIGIRHGRAPDRSASTQSATCPTCCPGWFAMPTDQGASPRGARRIPIRRVP